MSFCRTFNFLAVLLFFFLSVQSQTPVSIASQSQLSYTETFSDISNWTFGTNGVFTSGTGALSWRGCGTSTSGTIPDGVRITTSAFAFATGSSGGVQRGTGNLQLLSTGSTDNTSAVAMDFFADFTGVNAGTISFDWASVNNSTGDRKASVRVYASTDGNSFIELTGAQVLNFTNNILTSGSITNVSLPSSLNNSSSARIRFYFYNGTGGSTGSRPKFSLDNVKVTGTAIGPCSTPTTQPTNLIFSNVGSTTVSGSFTAASGGADKYLLLLSNSPVLTSNPTNDTIYNIGDNIDDATVVGYADSLNFSLDGLNTSTLYYLFVFSANDLCIGGPLFRTTNPLLGFFTTNSGLPACVAPSAQPITLSFSNVTTSSFQGSFQNSANTDQYLVILSRNATLTAQPVNAVVYNPGDSIGGGLIISTDASTTYIKDSLLSATTYYSFVYAVNAQNCQNGPVYNTVSPLSGSVTTQAITRTCIAPTAQATNLVLSADNSSVTGSFTSSGSADSYLVLISTSSTLTQLPLNNTSYTAGATLGNATVAYSGTANSFYRSGLLSSTTYYAFVFASNSDCTGGTKYLTTSPLSSSFTTTGSVTYNYYYGNLHAHSGYSDGNKDNPTYTPADDYAYAKNSMSMDFLGISEHNHTGTGMRLSNWAPGVSQANAATTSTFVALYGQEWGVISNGGHVLVYGIDSLIGWETGNYQIYVPQSDYISNTGLFRRLNQSPTAFATYAHPGGTDYNNVSGIAYSSRVDSAVVGCAVESGPAFSTATNYSDYPSSMGYLSFYTRMLSKGYRLGPLMDHDTHNTNFGRANENRLVVLAPSLTKANLIAAIKARRFYATQDMDTHVSLTVNNQVMGSVTSGSSAPVISITATDPTAPASATRSIKIMYGSPGSEVTATQLTSGTTGTLSFTHTALTTGSTVYYYADITINGRRTITAPVWYTRTAATAVPSASISVTPSLTENSLNNDTIQVTLTNTTFKNYTSGNLVIATSNITLNNAPTGLTVTSCTATSSTTANVVLSFNGTDFDQSISNFSITLAAAILNSGSALTSSTLSITANNEQITVGTITGFGLVQQNANSSVKNYTVSASQLNSSIIITSSAPFQISLNSGSGFTNSLTLNPNSSGTINNTIIYVRFSPTGNNVYSSNILHTSTAALTQLVAVSGTSFTTATACDSYLWNGINHTSSGDKTYTTTVNGTDSTATLRLTLKNSSTSTQTVSACTSYTWNGTTYTTSGTRSFVTTNVVGCDSTAILNLTIRNTTQSTQTVSACTSYTWNGTTYTTSGTRSFVTTNAVGCDSTAILNLTIRNTTQSTQTVSACTSYTWNGTTYTTSGTRSFVTTNAVGCDSTAILNLTIRNATQSTQTISACISYTWNGTTYTTSGTRSFVTTNTVGCDSTAILNLTIRNATQSTQTISACTSYTWNGMTYTTSGTRSFVTTNAVGCDSTAILNLTIRNATQSTQTVSACTSYTWNGTTYTTSGTRSFVTTNAVGCDSTAILNLTIRNTTQSTQTVSACNSYTWKGTTYTTSGMRSFITTNLIGCDSIVYLNLTINICPLSLNVRAFMEGFYFGGTMQPLLYDMGVSAQPNEVDTVWIDIWDSTHLANSSPDYTYKGVLKTNGWINGSVPGSFYNKKCYLAIRGRNTVETWSAQPILFQDSVSYNFTAASSSAFGDGFNPPLKNMGNGNYAIYSGDVNQDGTVDLLDMIIIDIDASTFSFGYLSSDCSGDGAADLLDMIQVENNSVKFIFKARP